MNKANIEELRALFTKDADARGPDSVHAKDLARARADDHWLHRFLLHNEQNVQSALAMMWESVTWRRDFKVNDVNDLVKMDIVIQGGFFPFGRDKDGSTIFVFKCKKYTKGVHDPDDLKRCVIYWFERMERADKGNPITIFFDMEGCGLSNMDTEFVKYLIGLFKQYYPYFLNYILIFEMPWILNAAFKLIKGWLPEKAVEKIKFISKKNISEFVPPEHTLTCWGGTNDYAFSFIPETELNDSPTPPPTNRKVHFADGSPMSESPEGSGDKDHDGNALSVYPSGIINFVNEGGELVSTLDLQNNDPAATISFKLKTTAPEKFRVRPSVGSLTPGAKTTVQVTLLAGFHLGSLSRDKFLLMSTILDSGELKMDLTALWKDTSGRKVFQHRLKCSQPGGDAARNGTAFASQTAAEGEAGQGKLVASLAKLADCQQQLHGSVRSLQAYQFATLFLVLLLGVLVSYVLWLQKEHRSAGGFCTQP